MLYRRSKLKLSNAHAAPAAAAAYAWTWNAMNKNSQAINLSSATGNIWNSSNRNTCSEICKNKKHIHSIEASVDIVGDKKDDKRSSVTKHFSLIVNRVNAVQCTRKHHTNIGKIYNKKHISYKHTWHTYKTHSLFYGCYTQNSRNENELYMWHKAKGYK